MTRWTRASLEKEIATVRENVAMARREVEAGNQRMSTFLEGWYDRLLSLQFEMDRIKDEEAKR